jgi:uncharacterized coiled-coil protein SlyX
MNEIKKAIQNMKEEINKDMETLKNNQSEINSSISPQKTSIESFINRVEQVENRVSGTEDKVVELHQTVKEHEKMVRKCQWKMQEVWDTIKRSNLGIMVMKEKIQTKGMANLFSRIQLKTSLTLRQKESSSAGS